MTANDTGYRPQLLNECPEEDLEKYLKSDEWCAQTKFDGRNRLLIKKGKECIGSNRKGLEVAISDEIKEEMKHLPDCVLAGEAVGDKVFCFDIISRKSLHFWERNKEIIELLKEFYHIVPVYTAWTEIKKRALLVRLRDNNEEGIVFKHKDALYTAGRPASGGSQLKFKFTASASCIVTKLSKSKRSIQVSVYDHDILTIIGNVTVYPNQDVPKIGDIVEVKYLYYFKGGSLFQPVLLGVRDDIDKSVCIINQLKYKKEEN